jgi:hypothetical protein
MLLVHLFFTLIFHKYNSYRMKQTKSVLLCHRNHTFHIEMTARFSWRNMRAIRKVHGLTLLFQVGTLWRFSDGLFFEVPPLARDALLTTLHPLLESMLQTVDHFEISCL